MYNFDGKVAVVTGGAQGIGRCIADEFRRSGASVCIIDCQKGDHFVGDLSDKPTLERFAQSVVGQYGRVDFLINNAAPLMKGIGECTFEEFQYALNVGVTAPFYLTKLFAPHFAEGAAVVNISSSRDRIASRRPRVTRRPKAALPLLRTLSPSALPVECESIPFRPAGLTQKQ